MSGSFRLVETRARPAIWTIPGASLAHSSPRAGELATKNIGQPDRIEQRSGWMVLLPLWWKGRVVVNYCC